MLRQIFFCAPSSKVSRHLYSGNEEPSVAELLADPIMGPVLERDGLTQDHVKGVVFQARANLIKDAA